MNMNVTMKELKGIEPGSTAWKAAMLTTLPPSLHVRAKIQMKVSCSVVVFVRPLPEVTPPVP